jgi:hypothetical protein|uniref:Uncharacterized protein n=1 Tax=Siphoviridae sp. ctWKa2 TaxID=2825537 RepID=A0A8S5PF82_9CAUD|nr:MAG TPA: hypothetical protein [Siphoviridae sp. ctWKa2]
MYTNTVRLPYTLWYDGKDKIFRMDMNAILPEEHYEDGKKYIGKIRNVQVSGYNVEGDIQPPPAGDGGYLDVSEWSTAVYNEEKHYADITLNPFSTFNADGEIALYIDFEMYTGFEEYISDHSYKKKELTIIIPIRSHENPSKDPNRFNNGIGIDRMDVRNVFSHTVGANEEPITFSFDLITRDITDEFITNGQALDMVKTKAVEHVSLTAKDSGLELSLNYNRNGNQTGNISWDNLKQYIGGSNPTEYVATTLEDILSMLDNADLNNNNRLTSIIALGLTTNMSVRENDSRDIDVNFTTTYYDSQGNNPTTRNFTLFTIPRSLLGGEGGTVDTEGIKNSILNAIRQQIPNAETIKQEILANIPNSSTNINLNFIDKITELITTYNYNTSVLDLKKHLHTDPDISKLTEILTAENDRSEYEARGHILYSLLNSYDLYTPSSDQPFVKFGNDLINHTTNLLDKITTDAADREKAGKLFQKLLDAETLNVVEKTDGYELSYTGDVNKVLVKIPKQAITVSQEVLTTAITENVVTETIKPTLDKSYYSKQEVDQLIQQLKHELMSEDHGEEHPQ